MSAEGKKKDKGFIALLVLIIVCACLMIAAVTTLGIGMSNGMGGDQTGQQGEQGEPGSKWSTGNGAPADSAGVVGDFYLDKSTGNVYEKKESGWEFALCIKGANGETVVPHIGKEADGEEEGYWYIGDKNTEVRAAGLDALRPSIGTDGYWYIGDEKTEWKATPDVSVTIEDGYWCVNGQKTNYRAYGSAWLSGDVAPVPEDGEEGDFYLNTETGEVYRKENNAWVSKGSIKGATGDPGATGPQGNPGADGSVWYTGTGDKTTGAPSDAKVGDYYLNTDTGDVYKKGASDWESQGNIKGQPGVDGKTWHNGHGAPDDADEMTDVEAKEGDFYFDLDSNTIYKYSGSAWDVVVDLTPKHASVWYHGETAPAEATGLTEAVEGDYYINTVTGDIYRYDSKEWKPLGSIKADAPHIGENGHWYVGETDTGVSAKGDPGAEGKEGKTPHIGNNGNWFIGETDTGYSAIGKDGVTPSIGEDGYWYFGEVKTEYKAVGTDGKNGTYWHSGEGVPTAGEATQEGMCHVDAAEGDFYMDTESGKVYLLAGGEWEFLICLKFELKGNQWTLNGKGTGLYVTQWYSGEGDPTNRYEGYNGDYYLDTKNGKIYKNTSENVGDEKGTAWEEVLTIRGTKWFSGEGAPDGKDFGQTLINDDMYLDTEKGQVYRYNGKAWEKVDGLVIKGEKGERGERMFAGTEKPQDHDFGEEEPKAGDIYFETGAGYLYTYNGSTWDLLNEKDPLAGTKWLSGTKDPTEYEDGDDLYEALSSALNGDVFFNTAENTLWQYEKHEGEEGKWNCLGTLSAARGTKVFYGVADPFSGDEDEKAAFAAVTKDAIVGDMYVKTYYAFSGLKGFNLYVKTGEKNGVSVWELIVEMTLKAEDGDYKIPNKDALAAFKQSVNSNKKDFTDKTVTLTGVVEIPEDRHDSMTGIGNEEKPFNGTFDGGHSESLKTAPEKSGLYIDGLKGTLFGKLDHATIKDADLYGTLNDSSFTFSTDPETGKVSLLNGTYGLAQDLGGSMVQNVRLTLENDSIKVVIYWDEKGDVTVTVSGKTDPQVAAAAALENDLTPTFEGTYELGAANFSFSKIKLAGVFNVNSAKSFSLAGSVVTTSAVALEKFHNAPIYGVKGSLESFTLDTNIFTSPRAAYIYSTVKNVNVKGNTFGTKDAPMADEWAVKFMHIGENAELNFTANIVYGKAEDKDDNQSFYAFDLYDSIKAGTSYTAKFSANTVTVATAENADKAGILRVEAAESSKGKVYFLNNQNTVNGSTKLFDAVAYTTATVSDASEKAFALIAFDAMLDGSEENKLFEGKVYLGSNFGTAEEREFGPDDLQTASVNGESNHNVWIIDLAFADPTGFVQHVADYTDHYYVNNANGLGSFRDMVNGTYMVGEVAQPAKNFSNLYVVQAANIDLAEEGVENWTPIGSVTTPFSGDFSMKLGETQYKLQNLTISGECNSAGLFGYVGNTGASLHDVVIENVSIDVETNSALTGTDGVGALVGRAYQSTITNVTVQGTIKITGNIDVGGVAGRSEYSKLDTVKVLATKDSESIIQQDSATNSEYIGGIVGFTGEGSSNTFQNLTVENITVSGCYNAGGVMGLIHHGVTVNGAILTNVVLEITGGWNYSHTNRNGVSGGASLEIGAVAGSAVSGETITVSNITFTGELRRIEHIWGSKHTSYAWYDGYVGGAYNNTHTKPTNVTISGTNSLYAKLADGFYMHDGVLEIGNANGLVEFSNMFDTVGVTYQPSADDSKNLKAVLTADIEMPADTKWTPITNSEAKTPYAGLLDGKNFEISGLTGSLFGITNAAVIQNLTLDGVTVTGDKNVAALISVSKGATTVENVKVTHANLTLNATEAAYARSIGGLVGAAESGLTLKGVGFGLMNSDTGEFDSRLTNLNEDLNLVLYNHGLVGSALNGEYASDTWANGKNVLPAATIHVEVSEAEGEVDPFTAYFNAVVFSGATTTDINHTATWDVNANAYASLTTVYTANGLGVISEQVNGGLTYAGETVMLGANIDMEPYGQKWAGIGNDENAFEGTFTGGYGIPQIPNKYIAHLYGPLFGNLKGAVQNLTLGDLNINKLADDSAASMATVAKKVENGATIKGVTVTAFVQKVGEVSLYKASDFAAAPFGFYAEGSAAVTDSNITVTFPYTSVTFNAVIDGESNATVTYTGDTFEGAPTGHTYGAVINNEHFILKAFSGKTATFTFDGIKFTGDTYINVHMVEGLTVTNCYADVTPAKATGVPGGMFQNSNSRSAFIAGTAEDQEGILLVVENNVILAETGSNDANGTAIFVWASLASGSRIMNNTFGSDTRRYTFAINKFFGATEGAILEFANNTMYGNAGFYTEGLAYCPNLTHDKDVQWVVDGNTLDIKTETEKTDYSLVCLENDPASAATRVYITPNNHVVYNGEEQTIGYEQVTKDSVFADFNYVGYNVELALTRDQDTNAITVVSVTSGDFILGGDDYMKDGSYHTGNSDRFDAQLKLLNGVVAESADKANVHIVIGDEFGRKLSDLTDEDEKNNNIYYIFNRIGLDSFIALTNAGFDFTGKEVRLDANYNDDGSHDLDLSTDYPNWTPIGTADYPFKGTFNGYISDTENWQISGLTYKGDAEYIGFFGYTNGAEIKNLTFDSASLEGTTTASNRYTGVAVGYAVGTKLTNINVGASTLKEYVGYAGAVAGYVESGEVSGINVNDTTITTQSTPNVGAVIGVAKDVTISDVFVGVQENKDAKEGDPAYVSSGSVSVSGSYAVGGVIGVAEDSITVGTDAVWSGAALSATSVTDEKNMLQIGGIIGALNASTEENSFDLTNAHFVGTLSRKGFGFDASTKYENYGLVGANTAEAEANVVISSSTLDVVHYTNDNLATDTFAQDTDWNDEAEVTSEYQINGEGALKFFRDQVNGGNSYEGETIHLLTDVNLNNEDWTPIGGSMGKYNDRKNPFSGTFTAEKPEAQKTAQGEAIKDHDGYYLRGDSYTITGLKADKHKAHDNEYCEQIDSVGLFGYTNGADIKYLNINGAELTAHWMVGVVVGQAWDTNFEHITVAKATAKAHSFVGGIAGFDDGNAGVWDGRQEVLNDCQVIGFTGQATPEKVIDSDNPYFSYGDMVGGLVGHMRASEITNNKVVGSKLTAYMFVGGALGMDNAGYVEIKDNTVVNTTIITKRSGFAKTENPDDPMMDYEKEYTYLNKTISGDTAQHADWLVGGTKYSVEEHDANLVGGETNNTKEGFVDVVHGYDKESKGLVYDNNAYHVVNNEGLETLRDLVNNGTTEHNGKTFKAGFEDETVTLDTDVNLQEPVAEPVVVRSRRNNAAVGVTSATPDWTPIGTQDNPFRGVFDGQNHTVSNLVIKNADHDDLGFFGHVSSESADKNFYMTTSPAVKNLTIKNVDIEAGEYERVGAVVGWIGASNGDKTVCELSNITVTNDEAGSVKIDTNDDFVGAVAGYVFNASLDHITVNATGADSIVKSTGKNDYGAQVGGIAGHVEQTTVDTVSTNIDVNGRWAGGLFGFLAAYGKEVTGVTVKADVTGQTEYVGGLVGSIQSTDATIKNSTYEGTLSLTLEDGDTLDTHAFVGTPLDTHKATVTDSTAVFADQNPEIEGVVHGAEADSEGNIVYCYLIKTVEGFAELAKKINDGTITTEGKTFALYDDMYLSTLEGGWTPIGTEEHPFSGHFDGKNCTISNLTISSATHNNVGLFGVVGYKAGGAFHQDIFIGNFTLKNVTINVTVGYVGAVVGKVNGNTGDSTKVQLSDITVTGNVTVTTTGDFAGGVAGHLFNAQLNNINVKDVTGNVSSSDSSNDWTGQAGGIAGHMSGVVANGIVSEIDVDGRWAGALAGCLEGANVTNATLSGTITGHTAYVGAVAGSISDGTNTLNSVTYEGTVTTDDEGGLLDFTNYVVIGKVYSESAKLNVTNSKVVLNDVVDGYSQTTEWDAEGNATVSVEISSAKGLKYFAQIVSAGNKFEDQTVTFHVNGTVDLGEEVVTISQFAGNFNIVGESKATVIGKLSINTTGTVTAENVIFRAGAGTPAMVDGKLDGNSRDDVILKVVANSFTMTNCTVERTEATDGVGLVLSVTLGEGREATLENCNIISPVSDNALEDQGTMEVLNGTLVMKGGKISTNGFGLFEFPVKRANLTEVNFCGLEDNYENVSAENKALFMAINCVVIVDYQLKNCTISETRSYSMLIGNNEYAEGNGSFVAEGCTFNDKEYGIVVGYSGVESFGTFTLTGNEFALGEGAYPVVFTDGTPTRNPSITVSGNKVNGDEDAFEVGFLATLSESLQLALNFLTPENTANIGQRIVVGLQANESNKGEFVLEAPLTINVPLTLRGVTGNETIKTDLEGGNLLSVNAANVTIENIKFLKESKNATNPFAFIAGPCIGLTVRRCSFTGQYQEGDNQAAVRGFVPNEGVGSNYLLEDNTFTNLRQPAYLGAVGTVKNNTVIGTRGFVVVSSYKVVFEGNHFENNAEDIAIIPQGENLYSIGDAIAISLANNNAYVDVQPLGVFVRGTTIEATGFSGDVPVTASQAFINILTYLNTLKGEKANTTPITIQLYEGTYSPNADNQFRLEADNVHLVGAAKDEKGEYTTVIDALTYECSAQAGFEISGDNCSVENIKFVTSSTNGNVAALKITKLDNETTIVETFSIKNCEIEGNMGHALNLHGVNNVTVDNVTITKYGKCGISIAKATDVTISNVDIQQIGGWADIGFMYGNGDAYSIPCDVTIDFDTCKFANGSIYSERPSEAQDGADVIHKKDGTKIENGATVADTYYATKPEHMEKSELVMTVSDAGTWALARKATFNAATEEEFSAVLGSLNSGFRGEMTVNGPAKLDTTGENGNIVNRPQDGMDIEPGANLIIDGTQADGTQMTIDLDHTAFNYYNGNEGILSGNITFKNIHFVGNVDETNTGYVLTLGFNSTANVTFENCTFDNMYCAVYILGNESETGAHVTIKDCTFTGTKWGVGLSVSENKDKTVHVNFEGENKGLTEENKYENLAALQG